MDEETAKTLRAPFPPEHVGLLPRVTCRDCTKGNCQKHERSRCNTCGAWISPQHIHLDYVGHGAVTDRLLEADPEWVWEPVAWDEQGLPLMVLDANNYPVGFWIRLTVAGTTRLGYGSCASNKDDAEKELIGDAIRNAAMRFGVALDLWVKGHAEDSEKQTATGDAPGRRAAPPKPTEPADPDKLFELNVRYAVLAALPEPTVDEAWANAGLPYRGEIADAATLQRAFLLVNAVGAAARKAGADLDAIRERVVADLAALAEPATDVPPDGSDEPESAAATPALPETPADAPAATETAETPEEREARKAAEKEWKRRTADLIQTITGVARNLPTGTMEHTYEEVKALHHTRLNAELEHLEGWTDMAEAPVEYRRWAAVSERLRALRSADGEGSS